jgi:hypothetical protein
MMYYRMERRKERRRRRERRYEIKKVNREDVPG